MKQCNFCIYTTMRNSLKKVEVQPNPSTMFPLGVDIFVDGDWVCWFAELPAQCEC